MLSDASTSPIPWSIVTDVAPATSQLRVADSPVFISVGLALKFTITGGRTTCMQPLTVIRSNNAGINNFFTSSPLQKTLLLKRKSKKIICQYECLSSCPHQSWFDDVPNIQPIYIPDSYNSAITVYNIKRFFH
jgi:hypothetical protein